MTEETFYVCDECGQKFEDECECLVHETLHEYEKVKNDLAFLDSDFKRFNPIEEDSFDKAITVVAKTPAACQFLGTLEDTFGFDSPFNYFNYPKDNEFPVVFTWWDDRWNDVEELKMFYNQTWDKALAGFDGKGN
nr:MAG TPA: Putative transcription factor, TRANSCRIPTION.7A [Caudoviricetes sp.]